MHDFGEVRQANFSKNCNANNRTPQFVSAHEILVCNFWVSSQLFFLSWALPRIKILNTFIYNFSILSDVQTCTSEKLNGDALFHPVMSSLFAFHGPLLIIFRSRFIAQGSRLSSSSNCLPVIPTLGHFIFSLRLWSKAKGDLLFPQGAKSVDGLSSSQVINR